MTSRFSDSRFGAGANVENGGLLGRKLKDARWAYPLRRIHDMFLERFTAMRDTWSIAIYTGESPLQLSPAGSLKNPVLTARHVRDVKAGFVADPFMVREGDRWYMFFEVYNRESGKGEIGLAISMDGFRWEYDRIVLEEPFHMSYPYVFKWRDQYFMIPESSRDSSIRLYKAIRFPSEWSLVKVILQGEFHDSSILYHDDTFWLFTCTDPSFRVLSLYTSAELTGPWVEHPKSPIVTENSRIARPGGRVLLVDNHPVRFAQDCYPIYGSSVRAFKITTLTNNDYSETEYENNPVISASGAGWNAHMMHNIDAIRLDAKTWVACVDGGRWDRVLELQRR